MKKKIGIIVLVVFLIGGGFILIKGRMGAESANSNTTIVSLSQAELDSITTKVNADGNIRTADKKDIQAKIAGLIEKMYIENGDTIKKNDKIIRIEDESLKRKKETAQLNLKEAEANYEDKYDKYQVQDKVNNLKLEEAKKQLKISTLSKEEKRISLNKKKEEIISRLKEAERNYKKSKETLADKNYLYNKGAITKNQLTQAKESYTKAENDYQQAKEDLNILTEKNIPNSMELANLKIENSRNNLELLKHNINNENIKPRDLELAKIKIEKAKNEVSEIQSKLNKVVLKSPYNGTIVETKVSEGSKVDEGTVVAHIADINDLIVEVMVDEIDINKVNIGQKAVITSDSFSENVVGKVSYIAPTSTKVGNINKYKTKIKLDNPAKFLKPGMFVNAEITTNHREDVIVLPSMAVLGNKDKFVFIAKDGKAVRRDVEIGLQSLSRVEVNGIEKGEKVIVGPFSVLRNLKDGTPVTGRNSQSKAEK